MADTILLETTNAEGSLQAQLQKETKANSELLRESKSLATKLQESCDEVTRLEIALVKAKQSVIDLEAKLRVTEASILARKESTKVWVQSRWYELKR